jgi:hypothetical protein
MPVQEAEFCAFKIKDLQSQAGTPEKILGHFLQDCFVHNRTLEGLPDCGFSMALLQQ